MITSLRIATFGLMVALTASAQWQSVDTWDMNDNVEFQTSDNGTGLGSHYNTNLHQFVQIPDDGLFIFAPTNTQGFSEKPALSSAINLTSSVVRLSWTYQSLNWTNSPTANNKIGIRLWDDTNSEYVSISLEDNNDKIFTYVKSSAGLGGLTYKSGRLINGMIDESTPRTVYMELDYANSEVRTYADTWQWNNGSNVHTNTVDFAGANVTNISNFQAWYQNWGTGDQIELSNLAVEMFSTAEPEGVYIAQKETHISANTVELNTFASLVVTTGDWVVVQAASNIDAWEENSIVFSGVGTTSPIQFSKQNAGATAYLWYAPVADAGIMDITLEVTNSAYATLGAYVVRSATGAAEVLAMPSTSATDLFAYTNIYEFGTSSTGVLIEAFAAYAEGMTLDNPNFVIDVNQGVGKRTVGTASFSDVSSITNIYSTSVTNRNGAVYGIAFGPATTTTPTDLYEAWVAEYPGLGSDTSLSDDADGDLLANLSEYAMGGDPSDNADRGLFPEPSMQADSGTNYLQYVHYERADKEARGLDYILEVGTDLIFTNWSGNGIEFVGSGASGSSGFNAVTNRIMTDDEGVQFLHLQIELTP